MSATKTRIMYIQQGWSPGRIGRVRFSKTGRTLYYGGRVFESLAGRGFKTNYVDVESGREYWISGPRRDGQDTLYAGRVEIDADVVDEYWRDVRGLVGVRDPHFFSRGVHGSPRHAEFLLDAFRACSAHRSASHLETFRELRCASRCARICFLDEKLRRDTRIVDENARSEREKPRDKRFA